MSERALATSATDKCRLGQVARAYSISPESHGDFFWVFVSRTFYYMAVSVQVLKACLRTHLPTTHACLHACTHACCMHTYLHCGLCAGHTHTHSRTSACMNARTITRTHTHACMPGLK